MGSRLGLKALGQGSFQLWMTTLRNVRVNFCSLGDLSAQDPDDSYLLSLPPAHASAQISVDRPAHPDHRSGVGAGKNLISSI